MKLEFNFLIFLFFWILVTHFKAGILTVPDPCPEIQPNTKVADMCQQSEAVEDTECGNDTVDSVVLRIKTHKDNCICLVTIDNQNNNNTLYITKYNNLNSAFPTVSNCGLEIDLDYPSLEKPMESISCSSTTLPLWFPLVQNGVLNLTSKIIEGNFSRGYCIQIRRDNINLGEPTLRVACAEHGLIPSTSIPQSTKSESDVSTTAITTNSSDLSTQSITTNGSDVSTQSITTNGSDVSTQSITTNGSEMSTAAATTESRDISTSTDTFNTLEVDNTRAADTYPKDTSSSLYIGVGCGVAGVIVLIIIVTFIVCKRKSHKHLLKKTENESATSQERPDDPSYGLKDNILYVTSEQSASPEGDNTCIGAENPVSKEDDDMMLHLDGNATYKTCSNNQRDSNQNDNSIVYTVVDKTNRNQHQNASQIYAIVDKDMKHNQSVEHSTEQQ